MIGRERSKAACRHELISAKSGCLRRVKNKSVPFFAVPFFALKSAHYSNGKKKGEGNTKNGNAYLIWAFIEAANFARRFSEDAKRFFEKKKAKTNAVVATKALAHKLARASYHILKEKQPFDAKRCFA